MGQFIRTSLVSLTLLILLPAIALAADVNGIPDTFPNSTNTGYKNAPGYPGSLHACSGPIQSNTTYSFCDFSGGVSVGTRDNPVSNVTFYGSRFHGAGESLDVIALYGDNITIDYSSIEPEVAAPPVPFNKGYYIGIDADGSYYTNVQQLTVTNSDIWGFAGAIATNGSTQAKPHVFRNNYIHDARADGGKDHTDGVGETSGFGNHHYVVLDHNSIVSAGNTNGLAYQAGTYSHFSVTNNYFSGFGYTVNLGNGMQNSSYMTFTGNTFGTNLKPVWGPLYGWNNGSGNCWQNNKIHFVPGTTWTSGNGWTPVASDDGKFWTPNGVSSTDYSSSGCSGTTPPPPPPAAKFSTGDRVQVAGGNLNVRSTPSTSGTLLGTQAVGVLGTVTGGPTAANGYTWWNINYDSGVDGWSVEDNLTKTTTPPPPPPASPTATLSASPTSITSGSSATLTWSSTNATSCTGSGFTASGTSGSTTVSPTSNSTYSVTCSGAGGTSPGASAMVTVTTPTTPPPTGTPAYCSTGGPQLWANLGACGWPGPTNTGVPAGTTLTNTSGRTITTNNAVISGENINGQLKINAQNVTVRNSKVSFDGGGGGGSNVIYVMPGASATIENVEIDGKNHTHACIWHEGSSMTVRGVNCYGVNDGIFSWAQGTGHADSGDNFTIEDSYIHNLTTNAANGHIDGYQTEGAANGVIRHNTFDLPTDASGGISIWNSQKNTSNILVENNLLTGGGFTMYAEDYVGANNATAQENVANSAVGGYSLTNIRVLNNKFSTSPYPHTSSSSCVGNWGTWFYRGGWPPYYAGPTDLWNQGGSVRSGNIVLETGQNIDRGGPSGCEGYNTSPAAGTTPPPPPPASPTATLSASPTSITSGQSATLTWSSTNATSCTASGSWSGSKATSGTQSVSPTANSTYTITCTGAGGTSPAQSATVTVTSTVPPPTGGKPSAANTGWQPTGVTLTASGGMNITTNGTVIDGKDISGSVQISANNVTIKRSRVRDGGWYPVRIMSGATNVTIEDTEIDGLGGPSDGGQKCILVEGGAVLIQRVNIHDCEDGLSLNNTGGITLKDSYLHDPRYSSSGHADGFELYGGSNMTIQNDNIDYRNANTSAINLSDDWARITNIAINGNWLAGGAYTMYLDGNFSAGGMDNIRVTNNRWVRNTATYGVLVARGDLTNVCWSGNVYDDNNQAINYDGPGSVSCGSTTPPPPPTSTKFSIGQQVTPNATVNVRSTAGGTLLGTQALGATGTVTGGPTVATLSGTSYTWWNINFNSGVDGWVGEDGLDAYTAPPPPPPASPTATISASPTSITSGNSSTLTWSSTNATSCTASGSWSGSKATSGTQSVSPTANATYTITCTGAGGTSPQASAMVTVTTPPTPPPTGGAATCPAYPAMPDANCTGWQHTGVTLKTVPGQVTSGTGWNWEGAPFNYVKITGNGAVLDGFDINGCVYVDQGVTSATIQRSRITGNCDYMIRFSDANTPVAMNVTDTEIIGGAVQLKGTGFKWLRVNAHGFSGKAAMTGSNSTVEDSYIHDNVCTPPDHQSGIGTNGGASNITMRHNNVDLNPTECTSGGIANYDDFGAFHNVLIEKNLINSAGYCLKAGFEDNNAAGNSGMQVLNNVFGRKYYPQCGSFGIVSNWMTAAGNVWSGNTWGGGAAATTAHQIGEVIPDPNGGSTPPPTSTKFSIGQQVATISGANVRQTAAGTLLGTQSAGAAAVVVGGPTSAVLGGTSYTWWNLNFTSGVDGWVADDNLTALSAPPPPSTPTATISASPTSITSGNSSTLTWSSTNATSCTASGSWSGSKATSGTQSVSPTANATYTITCTGAGGTSPQASASVAVNSVTPAPTATLSASPTSITSGQSATLTWSSTNATSCTGSGFTASGTSGSTTVSLTSNTTYSVTCSGAGGSASANASVAVTSAPPPPPTGNAVSLWSMSDAPSTASYNDPAAVELGVKFRSSTAGQVTGVRFYKGSGNTGTHIGSLWSNDGTKLASGTFVNETATGWQTLMFASPVTIEANTTYVASYFAPQGRYAANGNYFSSSRVNGVLSAPTGNGVYRYGSGGGFPNQTYNATNYWVDVLFTPTTTTPPPPTTPAPTATLSVSPTSILSGGSATLTWSSTDATSCMGSGFTANGISGTAVVSPTANTTYGVTCTGAGGTSPQASAAVSVTVPETLTLGNNTIGGGTDSSNSNFINAMKFKSGAKGGTAQSISVYVSSPIGSSPNNQYSLAIYTDNGGTPGTLIAQAGTGTLTGNAWNTLPITATIAANTTYWLAYNTNGTATNQNNIKVGSGSSNQMRWRSQTFGTWPSNFGTPAGSSANTASIYLMYQSGEVLGVSTIRFTSTLAPTWSGPEVTLLQNVLKSLGFFTAEATGYFGNQTAAAVRAFQSANGLEAVGIVGPKTRALLNSQ